MITIRKATVADANALSPTLREADRQECRAVLGMEPGAVLPLNTTEDHCWVVLEDVTPIAMFGVVPVHMVPELGIVWMVTTDMLFRHKKLLVKKAPEVLEMLHSIRPLLGNRVDVRNTLHTRWLRRMGFSFLRVLPEYGVERRPFIEFARLR